jgi:peptide/nickel transport system substrate-binding protein
MRRRAMLTGSSAAFLTKTAIGQDRRANTLRFVPLANLSVLDPVWSSDPVASLHGNYVFDTLYAVDGLRHGRRWHPGTRYRTTAACGASGCAMA